MTREKNPASAPAKKREPRKPVVVTKRQAAVTAFVDPEKRAALIAEAAFFRAEKRGFAPGHETEDWLAAESEVDAKLMSAESGPRV